MAGRKKSNFAKDELKAFISRVERLIEERSAINSDIREVYDEAQNGGFVPKIMRQVIRKRSQDKAQRQEKESLLDLYLDAVGFDSTPLGKAVSEPAE